MINKVVISVVAGCSLLGSTLVAAQCPPNLNAEDTISCVIAEGAGEIYIQPRKMVELPVQSAPVATPQIDQAAVDNGYGRVQQ